MKFYYSSEEKKYWILSLSILVIIFLSILVNEPIIKFFSNQGIQAIIFLFGMFCVGIAVIIHAFWRKPHLKELLMIIGIIAVYSMFFLRLGLPERTHLIEYSILAIFIHKALELRTENIKLTLNHNLAALLISMTVGLIDEVLQLFVPHRYFDPEDILFNCLAVLFAIGSKILVDQIRKQRL